jgi:dienelactone hydrolase
MPDAIGFEDRRRSGPGTAPREDEDRLAYLTEMAHRLVSGRLLMSAVVADAAAALGVLMAMDEVDAERVGALGHSMGGNTTLFHAALDPRVRFACASGAAATYRARIAAGTGIELAQVIPGILHIADVDDLVALIAPRPLLLVSATEDEYSRDADDVERTAAKAYARLGAAGALRHTRFAGAHALTPERFEHILAWVNSQAHAPAA